MRDVFKAHLYPFGQNASLPPASTINRPVMLMPDGPNTGFLIDPQFVIANKANNGGGADARLFPYYSRAPLTATGAYWEDPRLRRVSLGIERDWDADITPPGIDARERSCS